MPSLTREIPHGSDNARMLLAEIRQRVRLWESGVSRKVDKWKEAEERVLAYLPEREVDSVRRTSRENGLPQYTTIQIPYSYAVVMAAHTYLTSVFMGRDPVFQFTGRHGETQQQVQAIEALIAYQVLNGRMLPYIYTWLYDFLKYGPGIIGCWWDERFDAVTNIQEFQEVDPMTQLPLGPTSKKQKTDVYRTYAGNRIYNVQPQSFVWDVRYTMREFQSGEYAGEKRNLGWNELIRMEKQGYLTNIKEIKKGSKSTVSTPLDGSSQLERPDSFNLNDMLGEAEYAKTTHPMVVECYRLCIEVIPNEWRLSSSDYPEKWVFTCTSDYNVLLGAQPLGAVHCKHPYSVIAFEPEGYGLITRGMPEILQPVQQTVDWLINSHFYNVRAALNDRFVVDPSRVIMKDVLNPLPGQMIRLKPEAYGTDPKLVIAQFPTSNVTQTHMQDFGTMIGIGERVGGVNDQIMGMLSTGGRKTATEVRTSTSFGINRLKTVAEWASAVAFDPLSQMLVQNSQQYYDMELKLKIAGDLAMTAGPGFLLVRPEDLAGAYDFVPVDGTLPIDRFAQVQLWQELFQSILTVPQIGMQYDLGGIFTWVAQLAGLKNINQFKIQVMPDQVLAQQAQMGNAVPMGGKPNGALKPQAAPKAAGPGSFPAGQFPGMM